jgi:hypothetical protein
MRQKLKFVINYPMLELYPLPETQTYQWMNIKLPGTKNSCVETGLCSGCHTPSCICNMWSIIEGHMIGKRIHVKLIGETVVY